MKKGQQVMGMPVMGVKEGMQCGIARGFEVDPLTKKVSSLILKGDRNEFDFRILKREDVVSVGKDFIVTKTVENQKEMGPAGELILLMGMKCVSGAGDLIGSVQDFEFNEKSGEIALLNLDSGTEVQGKEILTISNDYLFLSSEISLDEEEKTEPEISAYEKEQKEYLTGKTAGSDVVSDSGEVLIKKGTKITEEIIDKARIAGLLTELTMSVD
jgi:uncharacterized protein YrrD